MLILADYYVDSPTKPSWEKHFDYLTGNMILVLNSNFTYNDVFVIENFTIEIVGKYISLPIRIQKSLRTSNFRNISGFHNTFVNGIIELSVPPEWNNVSIFTRVYAFQNQIFFFESSWELLDYHALISGIYCFLIFFSKSSLLIL